MAKLPKPIVPLLEWQHRWIEDQSRFKLVVASTQSGKSFGTSLEMALDRLQPGSADLGIMLSASGRQSDELMQKVRMHTDAWKLAFDSRMVQFEDEDGKQIEVMQHTATFPNGKRLIALPANPATARGYSGDVFLDEFALHVNAKAIWAAMMGRITRGYKVRVASTIHGTDNKFYELLKTLGLHEGTRPSEQPVKRNGWSGHWVDVFMCREQGLDLDIEALRQAIDDDEIFLQEYCNVPISGAENFIPLELVLACESSEASLEWDGKIRPGLSAGGDIGRVKDRSVIFIGDEEVGLAIVRGVKWMERMPFAQQKKIFREVAEVVQASGGRFPIDATGIGFQMAEELHDEFPCVEPVQFAARTEVGGKTEDGKAITVPVKERMAVLTKRRFEERTLRLPESSKIRRATQAVKRYIGATGNIRFDAARTDQGHADEFWALALWLAGMDEPRRTYVPAASVGLIGETVGAGVMEAVF